MVSRGSGTAATSTSVAAASGTLARTGSAVMALVVVALGSIATGAVLWVAARRRSLR